MGAGGQMKALDNENDILKRVPISKPPFGIADLKRAVPPHCFKRSLIRSLGYVFRDAIIIYTFYYIASNYFPLVPNDQPLLYYIGWPLYWLAQGSFLYGVWVLGHECGHHSFSDYQWIDDTVGFILHSLVMTPYFSFKYSHRSHHAHTNSLEYDEVYIPKRKSDTFFTEFLNNGPGNVFTLFVRITLGYPLYMLFNVYGRDYKRFTNHFLPQSGIFNDSERGYVVLSDIGIITVLYALYHLAVTQGGKSTLFLFVIPLFMEGGFFILSTYLSHTHPSVAHYDSTEWDWLRGALSTIDRDFGILNWIQHDLNSSHVIHHLFPNMPHYHAVEATKAVRPILGEYYMSDNTHPLKAFWRETKECIYARTRRFIGAQRCLLVLQIV